MRIFILSIIQIENLELLLLLTDINHTGKMTTHSFRTFILY